MSLDTEADVVVVGAGHNSLVAAGYLAQAGLDVVVLEATPSVGGGTVTEELTVPGFWHDPASTGHPTIQANPLVRDDELGLRQHGLRYVAPDPVTVVSLRNGDSVTIWRDPDATADEFARYSAADATAWKALLADWDRLAPLHLDRIGNPPSPLVPGTDLEREYAALATGSAWDEIHRRFESDQVRAAIAWMATASCQPLGRDGSGLLALSVPADWARYGWTVPIGGSGALAQALERALVESGGRVLTDARVQRIVVEGGRATGVETGDGRSYRARKAVLSSMHVVHLVDAVGAGVLPTEFTEPLEGWRPGWSLFVIHLALPRAPRYPSSRGLLQSVLWGTCDLEALRRQMADAAEGRATLNDPWLFVPCATVVDPGRAPDGQATLKVLTIAPYALDGDPAAWHSAKHEYADHLSSIVASRVEGYEVGEELGRHVESPADLEARNAHFWRGAPHSGETVPPQVGTGRPVKGWASYRMPVEGLYQTGATTHPGGAVTGFPGRNAARVILEDLGLR